MQRAMAAATLLVDGAMLLGARQCTRMRNAARIGLPLHAFPAAYPLSTQPQGPPRDAHCVFAVFGTAVRVVSNPLRPAPSPHQSSSLWQRSLPAAAPWRSAARPSWPGSLSQQQQCAYRRGQQRAPCRRWRWPSPLALPTSGEACGGHGVALVWRGYSAVAQRGIRRSPGRQPPAPPVHARYSEAEQPLVTFLAKHGAPRGNARLGSRTGDGLRALLAARRPASHFLSQVDWPTIDPRMVVHSHLQRHVKRGH